MKQVLQQWFCALSDYSFTKKEIPLLINLDVLFLSTIQVNFEVLGDFYWTSFHYVQCIFKIIVDRLSSMRYDTKT